MRKSAAVNPPYSAFGPLWNASIHTNPIHVTRKSPDILLLVNMGGIAGDDLSGERVLEMSIVEEGVKGGGTL